MLHSLCRPFIIASGSWAAILLCGLAWDPSLAHAVPCTTTGYSNGTWSSNTAPCTINADNFYHYTTVFPYGPAPIDDVYAISAVAGTTSYPNIVADMMGTDSASPTRVIPLTYRRVRTANGSLDTVPAQNESRADHSIVALYNSNTGLTNSGKMLVFLPAAGNKPRASLNFMLRAAASGYLVIGLPFRNNADGTGLTPDNCNDFGWTFTKGAPRPSVDDCISAGVKYIVAGIIPHNDYRSTVFTGFSTNQELATIDSIEGRLLHVLRYLNTNFSSQGWGAHLDSGFVKWDGNIHFAGLSMGASQIPYIVTRHNGNVGKGIMLAGPVYYIGSTALPHKPNASPSYVDAAAAYTTNTHLYQFFHENDETNEPKTFDLNAFGAGVLSTSSDGCDLGGIGFKYYSSGLNKWIRVNTGMDTTKNAPNYCESRTLNSNDSFVGSSNCTCPLTHLAVGNDCNAQIAPPYNYQGVWNAMLTAP